MRHSASTWIAAACIAAGLLPAQAADEAGVASRGSIAGLRIAYERPATQWPAAWIDRGVEFVELAALPAPASHPRLRPRVALGRQLFFDRRLSVDGSVACADCHRPAHGWTVGTPVATGHAGQPGRRNPPGLLGVAARGRWGWDGSGASLEAQSLVPLTHPREMGHGVVESVLAYVQAAPSYAAALHEVRDAALTPHLLASSLAAFQASVDEPTRFERFLQGRERFSDREIHGLHLFRTRARCANCHFGPQLADGRFHNLGISFFGEPSQDLGLHEQTGRCEDAGRFRTASLRHVARTAPYMHNGLFPSLAGVIHLYARGGGEVRARNAVEAAHPLFGCVAKRSPQLRPLHLTNEEAAALEAFVRTL